MGLDNPIHIAFLLILLLLVFGAKRLPEMGRSLGDGMRGFKDAISGDAAHAAAAPAAAQPLAQPALQAQQETPAVAAAAVSSGAPVAIHDAPVPVQAIPAQQPLQEKLSA
jgi:sec-independent protein translocase protein TatA